MVSETEPVRESGSVRTKKNNKSSNMQNLVKFILFRRFCVASVNKTGSVRRHIK